MFIKSSTSLNQGSLNRVLGVLPKTGNQFVAALIILNRYFGEENLLTAIFNIILKAGWICFKLLGESKNFYVDCCL